MITLRRPLTDSLIAALTLSLALLALSAMALADDAVLQFEDPWVPEAPPGRMMAGFMVIHNAGAEDIVLVDVKAEGFGHAEIHDMVIDEEGIMRMRRIDALTIPAGDAVALASGGFHLMLMQPQAAFSAGDQITMTLIDTEGQSYPVSAAVRPRR